MGHVSLAAALTPPNSVHVTHVMDHTAQLWHEDLVTWEVGHQTGPGPMSLVTHVLVTSTRRKERWVTPWTCSSTDSGIFFWGPQGDECVGQAEEGLGVGHHLGSTKPEPCGYHIDLFSRNLHKDTECISSAGQGESTMIRIQSCRDWGVPLKSVYWADLVCFSLLHLKNISGCAFVTGTIPGQHTVSASNRTYFINVPWVITKTWLQILKNLFLFKYNKQAGLEICKNCLIIFLSPSVHLFTLIDMKNNFMEVAPEKNECRRRTKERNLKQKPQPRGTGKKEVSVVTCTGNLSIALTFWGCSWGCFESKYYYTTKKRL